MEGVPATTQRVRAGVSGEALPGPREYVRIAVILAVITAGEVSIYYIRAVRPALVPLLLVMSVSKFSLVALYFMHLKFDSRLFRRLFMAGIGIAVTVYLIVLVIFGALPVWVFAVAAGGALFYAVTQLARGAAT